MLLIGDIRFQLHHTGIKTVENLNETTNVLLFQLHHTGIKTLSL